jgi:5-(carboxyamino)imidazole ribonucleotide synthase
MFEHLKIGILGGGQLGAMLLRYAIDFGLNVSVMDKDPNASCARHTDSFYTGDPLNFDDVMRFGQNLDIITIEKEAVNTQALRQLALAGKKVYPSPDTIEIIQDKFTQKQFLSGHNIPVVPGILVGSKADLVQHIDSFPACLKKCSQGYDGKGVMILKTAEDINHAFDEPCVLEKLIDIRHEISVIVSRSESGSIECYDPVLMVFNKDRMILDFQMCPANIDVDIALQACSLAIKTAEALQLVGIMAVEMFLDNNGKLYVNELAPRPHNSGHHTIEAHTTSQFEQQMRLILGLPMGSTKLNKASVMINILEPAAFRKKRYHNSSENHPLHHRCAFALVWQAGR